VNDAKLLRRSTGEEAFWTLVKAATWIFLLVFIFLPILWLILTSFKISRDAYTTNFLFTPTLNNFRTIFNPPMNFGPLVLNSFVVSITTATIVVTLGVMAAYAFSRYNFRWKTVLIVWVLSSQFVPPVVIALPFFNVYRMLSLLDTRMGLIILNLSFTLPFAIWMIKGFVDELPTEIEEAGIIDGCSHFQLMRHISIPLIMPGIITSFAFCFIQSWNEFMFALIMTRRNAVTLTVGLMSLDSEKGILWEQMAAAGLLVMVPIFVLSLTIRKYFIEGITMGAVKS
jgi:multiple sugar transport system permease protein